jgi:hypothetical protein
MLIGKMKVSQLRAVECFNNAMPSEPEAKKLKLATPPGSRAAAHCPRLPIVRITAL